MSEINIIGKKYYIQWYYNMYNSSLCYTSISSNFEW